MFWDQFSFGIVCDKFMVVVLWWVIMFKDCECCNFVVQVYYWDFFVQRGLLFVVNFSSVVVVKEVKGDLSFVVGKLVVKNYVLLGKCSSICRKRSEE